MSLNVSKLILYLVIAIFSVQTWAQDKVEMADQPSYQDITLLDPYLSYKYRRGPFLVYDCKAQHWVCTSVVESNRCSENRENELKDKKRELSCAAVKKFSSESECINEQKSLVDYGHSPRFCVNDLYKRLGSNDNPSSD